MVFGDKEMIVNFSCITIPNADPQTKDQYRFKVLTRKFNTFFIFNRKKMTRLIIFMVSGMLLLGTGARANIITLNKCYLNNQTSSIDYHLSKKDLKEYNENFFRDRSWSSNSWEKARILNSNKAGNYLWAKDQLPETMSENDFLWYSNWFTFDDNRWSETEKFIKKYKLNYSVLRTVDHGIKIDTKNDTVTFYQNYADEYIDFNLKKYQAEIKWWNYYKDKKIKLISQNFEPSKPFTEKNYTYSVKVKNLAGNIILLNEQKNPPLWHPELKGYHAWTGLSAELIKLSKLKGDPWKETVGLVSRSIDINKRSYEEIITEIYPEGKSVFPSVVNKYYYLCTMPGSKSGTNSYLDYWWALILIIGTTFFIYTQTGKELKLEGKNSFSKNFVSLFTFKKVKSFFQKKKNNKKNLSNKDDFNDYLG
jgi:hypothetical protein